MNPSPAFIEALIEERNAARELLRRPSSADQAAMALGRLADLDEIEGLALATIDEPSS